MFFNATIFILSLVFEFIYFAWFQYLVSSKSIEHDVKDDFDELKLELLSKLAEKMPSNFKYSSTDFKDGLDVLLETEMETTDNDFEEIELLPDLSDSKIEEYKSILSMLRKETSLKDKNIGKVRKDNCDLK